MTNYLPRSIWERGREVGKREREGKGERKYKEKNWRKFCLKAGEEKKPHQRRQKNDDQGGRKWTNTVSWELTVNEASKEKAELCPMPQRYCKQYDWARDFSH